MGMKAAKDFMTKKGGIIKWLPSAGQNYAEVTDAASTYQCWFEDADSLKLRLELVKQYDIAGVAAWKSGLETEDIWGVLKDELKNQDG
jgi:spore germination protein YaaH